MKLLKNGLLFALSAVVLTGISQPLQAQNVDAQMLLHPPADSWPGYQGDYTGQRHSKLTQITPKM
jgi:alcohol dehydrogenase (cytochrome c)